MKHGKMLRRLTALALSAAMAASMGYADATSNSGGTYVAPLDWITTEQSSDEVIVTFTIPEGTNYDRIEFPAFDTTNWTWVPGDLGDMKFKVVDETGNYSYDEGSLWIGTKEFDPTNPGEVVDRSYNPALYKLIEIEQYSASDNDDVEEQLTDEALGKLLIEKGYNEKTYSGIDDLAEFYHDFYGIDSLDQIDDERLAQMFSGRWNGSFTGMYDATGANETNPEVQIAGWRNLYTNLLTVDGVGLLKYSTGSIELANLDHSFAEGIETEQGVDFTVQIDFQKTMNCYQDHEIYLGLSFSMSLPGADPTPTPEPDPGDDNDKPSGGGDNDRYEGPDLTVVKVDEDGETIEANARFRIYKEQGKKTMWYKGNQSWSEDEEDAWIFNTSVGDGSFTAYDLKPGTYYIVEISAPEGYDLAEEPLEVEVESRDVTVEFVNSGDGVVTTPTKPVPDTGR